MYHQNSCNTVDRWRLNSTLLTDVHLSSAPPKNLTGIADTSVDVVTTRSVLIYVDNKHKALEEFHRALRLHGRISIYERINSLTYPDLPNEWFGYDVSSVRDLAERVKNTHVSLAGSLDAMLGFDERDLYSLAEQVGFVELHLELRRRAARRHTPRSWEKLQHLVPESAVADLRRSNRQSVIRRRSEAFHCAPAAVGGGRPANRTRRPRSPVGRAAWSVTRT